MTSIAMDLKLKNANTSQAEDFVHNESNTSPPEMAFNTGLNLWQWRRQQSGEECYSSAVVVALLFE